MEGTLYDITGRYVELLNFAADGEVDDEIFADTLQGIEDELEDKAENYLRVIKELEVRKGAIDGELEVIQKEVDRRKAHIATIDRHIARMKSDLCYAMGATGKKKIKTQNFSIWTQESSEVNITDEANIPMEYYDVPEPKVSKKRIKEDLVNGKELTFAKLDKHETLRFR